MSRWRRSRRLPHGATIKAVGEFDAGAVDLVTISNVAKVTISGFKIRALLATSHSYRGATNGIAAIGAASLAITGNDIRPTGTGQFCGLAEGIYAQGGSTGTISGNVIKDYRGDGIAALDSGTKVTIANNTITFAHLNFLQATGESAIALSFSANGTVKGNTLNGPPAGPGHPSQPFAGIGMFGTGPATSVHDNTISNFASDIRIVYTNGSHVYRNEMSGGQVGINLLDGDQMEIDDNTSSDATVHGLYIAGPMGSGVADGSKSTYDDIHDNDFRSNSNQASMDCQGESPATTASAAHNTFDLNQGTSDPAIICEGPVPH